MVRLRSTLRLRHLVVALSPLMALSAQGSVYVEAGLGGSLGSTKHRSASIDAALRVGAAFSVTPLIQVGPEITLHKDLATF